MKKLKFFLMSAMSLLLMSPVFSTVAYADDSYTVSLNLGSVNIPGSVSYDEETGVYTVVNTGPDVVIYSNPLTFDLPKDSCMLTLEYQTGSPHNISFYNNNDFAHNQYEGITLDATAGDEWATFSVDLNGLYISEGFGKAGAILRVVLNDPSSSITTKIRNIRFTGSDIKADDMPIDYVENSTLTTSTDNNMTVYTIAANGTSSPLFSGHLLEGIPADSCVLSFEYSCTTDINGAQIYFWPPDGDWQRCTPNNIALPATGKDRWATFRLDVDMYRYIFDWGSRGNYLRIHTNTSGVTVSLRNIHFVGRNEGGNTLGEYLEAIDIDGYVYGTGAGYVGDESVYNDFYDTYYDAVIVNEDASSTDEAKANALASLKAAKEKLDAAVIPLSDGVYFIQGASSSSDGDEKLAWHSLSSSVDCMRQRNRKSFMWEIKKLDDGNYSIQNLATGKYVSRCETNNSESSPLLMSEGQENEQKIYPMGAGLFSMLNAGTSWPYSLYDDSYVSNSGNRFESYVEWRLVPVTEEELAEASAQSTEEELEILRTKYAEYKDYCSTLVAGDGVGQISQNYIDTFAAAIEEALNSATQDSGSPADASKTMDEAYEILLSHVKMPEAGKWYYILSADDPNDYSPADGYYGVARRVNGAALYVLSIGGSGKGEVEGEYCTNQLRWGMDNIKNKPREGDVDAIWRLVAAPESFGKDAYYIQNLRTGWYVGECNAGGDYYYLQEDSTYVPYRIDFIGEQQFIITPLAGERAGVPILFGDNARQVRGDDINAGPNTRAAFTFEEFSTEENPEINIDFYNDSARIVTLPFAVSNIDRNDGVKAYALHSVITDEDELGIGIGLKEKYSFEAGEPFIIVVGDTAQHTSESGFKTLTFDTPDASSLKTLLVADTVNGLIGTFDRTVVLTDDDHDYIYFRSKVRAQTRETVSYGANAYAHAGYIDPALIVNQEGDPDVILYSVNGPFRTTVDIENALAKVKITDAQTTVNVYTVDGSLVKKNVKVTEAAKGLQKGLYIIGKEKVLVK